MSTPHGPASSAGPRAVTEWGTVALMLLIGVPVGVITAVFGSWVYAPVLGWAAAALTFCFVTYAHIRGKDAAETEAMATRDDPSPELTDILIVLASVASLVAVGYLLVHANSAHGAQHALLAALAVFSVAVSWALVHVLYLLRYAVLYYSGTVGGINFNQQEPPAFTDFAYMAFTIGMTYQVSDTNLQSTKIRMAVLRHGLLSFVFGSSILATAVNLIAGGLNG